MEFGRERAEFNDAIGYLTRINYLFYIADGASMSLDVYKWFHALMCLYRELSTKMKPTEITHINNLRQVTALLVNRYVQNPRNSFGGTMKPELYEALHLLELELRHVYKESGLEMKFSDDPSLALKG